MVSRKPALLWVLCAIAVALRAAYFALYRDALPFWDAPIADAEVYQEIAASMAAGDWLDPSYGYRAFGYPLWLGAVFAVAGPSPAVAYVLQGALGIATVLLAYGVAARLWGERA